MVGTAEYQFGAGRSLVGCKYFQKDPASNFGAHTTDAPPTAVQRTFTSRPWRWERGMTLRQTCSAADRPSVDTTQSAPVPKWPCVSGTTLGLRVVPLVCITNAMASRVADGNGGGDGGGFSSAIGAGSLDSVAPDWRSVKRPHRELSATSCKIGMPNAHAARAAAKSERAFAGTMSNAAGKSANSKAASSSARSAEIGATGNRADIAKKHVQSSGRLGSAIATRAPAFKLHFSNSSGATPSCANACRAAYESAARRSMSGCTGSSRCLFVERPMRSRRHSNGRDHASSATSWRGARSAICGDCGTPLAREIFTSKSWA